MRWERHSEQRSFLQKIPGIDYISADEFERALHKGAFRSLF